MAAPPITERHKPHFHRQAPILEPVRCATPGNVTIATALNVGDTIDGVTLAGGERVLVRAQSAPAENGIYFVGSTPGRTYDLASDEAAYGFLVHVLEGTALGGKVYRNENTASPAVGTDAITFAELSGGGGTITVEELDGAPSASPVDTIRFHQDDFTVVDNADGSVTVTADEPDAAAHIADTTDAHDASAISFDATGLDNTDADDVQEAIADLDAAITAGGGGGGVTIQYPGLKPSPPTYDFDGAALDGAFSAHSSLGSFTTSHVKTQGEAWGGSSVELQFSGQMGQIYVGHSNTDFDFEVGGVRKFMHPLAAMMIGIAALDSSGNGVGMVAYNDGHAYLAGISAYQYTGNSDSWTSQGQANASLDGDWWFRLKRISGTWTGYLSRSGRAWDKVFATRADSITVDRLAFGQFYNTVTPYYGRLAADYMHVTT